MNVQVIGVERILIEGMTIEAETVTRRGNLAVDQ